MGEAHGRKVIDLRLKRPPIVRQPEDSWANICCGSTWRHAAEKSPERLKRPTTQRSLSLLQSTAPPAAALLRLRQNGNSFIEHANHGSARGNTWSTSTPASSNPASRKPAPHPGTVILRRTNTPLSSPRDAASLGGRANPPPRFYPSDTIPEPHHPLRIRHTPRPSHDYESSRRIIVRGQPDKSESCPANASLPYPEAAQPPPQLLSPAAYLQQGHPRTTPPTPPHRRPTPSQPGNLPAPPELMLRPPVCHRHHHHPASVAEPDRKIMRLQRVKPPTRRREDTTTHGPSPVAGRYPTAISLPPAKHRTLLHRAHGILLA